MVVATGALKAKEVLDKGDLSRHIFFVLLWNSSHHLFLHAQPMGLSPLPTPKGASQFLTYYMPMMLGCLQERLFLLQVTSRHSYRTSKFSVVLVLTVQRAVSSSVNCDEVMKQGISHVLNFRV